MPHPESEQQLSVVNRQLVIYKVGALGCAPLDFMEAVAEEYDAGYVSSDRIRNDIIDGRESRGVDPKKAKAVKSQQLRRSAERDALATLSTGEDVVIDMFFNTNKSRETPAGIAGRVGGMTLALWINTPPKIALPRVREWTKEDAFEVPIERWDFSPIRAAQAMRKQVERPVETDSAFVFNLDGSTDTDGLLDQVDEWMERTGLADRYEFED